MSVLIVSSFFSKGLFEMLSCLLNLSFVLVGLGTWFNVPGFDIEACFEKFPLSLLIILDCFTSVIFFE